LNDTAEIKPDQAHSIALELYPGGTILKTELEYEKGVLVYEIKISTAEGRIAKVEIDATTGSVLKNRLKNS